MRRGELWWSDLAAPLGSGPGFTRPVLIVQSNAFNQSRIQTVVVIALTSNLQHARSPGNVLLAASKTGLSKDSVANVSQIATIDKNYLRDQIGLLDQKSMELIDEGLSRVLDLA